MSSGKEADQKTPTTYIVALAIDSFMIYFFI